MAWYREKKTTEMIKLPQEGAAVAFNECLSHWPDWLPVMCVLQSSAIFGFLFYNYEIPAIDEVDKNDQK